MENNLLSVEEVARRLGGLSKFTIHTWLSQGRLRRTKVGGRTMIRESELQKVIEDGGKSPAPRKATAWPLHVVPKKIGKRDQRVVPPFVLEEFIPADAWEDFEQHRIRKGKPLDDGTRWAAQKRLRRFHGEGQDVREIIEYTIISGWQGLFPNITPRSRDAALVVTNPVQALDKIRRVS